VAELLLELLKDGLSYRWSVTVKQGADEEALKGRLHSDFVEFLRKREKRCHEQLRALYKHNIFNCELPPQSILQEDLFPVYPVGTPFLSNPRKR